MYEAVGAAVKILMQCREQGGAICETNMSDTKGHVFQSDTVPLKTRRQADALLPCFSRTRRECLHIHQRKATV